MEPENKKIFTKKNTTAILIYIAVLFAILIISYHTELSAWLSGILDLFAPVLLGLAFAYICNPLFRFFERKLLLRVRPAGLRRALSLLFSYLILFGIVVCLVWLILPQLIQSITLFASNYQTHVDSALAYINGMFVSINGFFETFIGPNELFKPVDNIQLFSTLETLLKDLLQQIELSDITGTAGSVISGFADVIFALFISIYLLSSKEKRYAQVMKLRHAIFSDTTNRRITKVCTDADTLFGKFLEGKLVDSLIVGVLTYIVISLFGIPYALLIASVVGIFNIIPVIGFLVALIPTSLIVFLTDADKFLPFLIILFVIYQIDANIISPKVLGNNTGVSALCVIISICVMGTLWGFIGMILGVPLFATILELTDSFTHQRLQKKRCPDDVDNYYAPDATPAARRNRISSTGRWINALLKKVLHAKARIEKGHEAELTFGDRFALKLYAFANKARIIKDPPPDILTQFAAEQEEAAIRHEALQELERRLALLKAAPVSADLTDAVTDMKGE